MSKSLVQLEGFDELKKKIKRLPDKVKRKEVQKILRVSAKSTVTAARAEAPISKKAHTFRGGRVYQPGNLKKSIRTKVMTRARVPMVIVGPTSTGKKYDGFYGRSFVIPGHRTRSGGLVKPNPFMQRGHDKTAGLVTGKAVRATEKYIQKQINKL